MKLKETCTLPFKKCFSIYFLLPEGDMLKTYMIITDICQQNNNCVLLPGLLHHLYKLYKLSLILFPFVFLKYLLFGILYFFWRYSDCKNRVESLVQSNQWETRFHHSFSKVSSKFIIDTEEQHVNQWSLRPRQDKLFCWRFSATTEIICSCIFITCKSTKVITLAIQYI